MESHIKKHIDLAAGRERSELVLKNAQIINVFSAEIINGDVAINDGKIVGVGNYDGIKNIDLEGKFVIPGLIDSHVHIESAMVTPGEFARTIVPKGTTTIIADPHEIANVCGMKGIEYMLNCSEDIPLNVYMMLPSCVPATSIENSGAILKAEDLKKLINHERVLGLGELMDYPNVIKGKQDIIDKLIMADEKIIDGHGPEIEGKDLNAYSMAGVRTEHECSTVEEMIDRLRLGMYILIREGSAARNLKSLIKGITTENSRRCLFCTDDKHPQDIIEEGHIDNNVRLAIKEGIDPIKAIQMATINAAECYGLQDIGAIAPGYRADLVVLDNLEEFSIEKIFKAGKLIAEENEPFFSVGYKEDNRVMDTVNVKKIESKDIAIPLEADDVNVIKLLSHSLVTEKVNRKVKIKNGLFQYDKEKDILKMAVIERHKNTGNIGLGLVENFKLKEGAIASTIAHDSHNIIVIGDNDEDMILAVNELNRVGGGITICSKGNILQTLSLPIAGLIAETSMESVNEQLKEMLNIAYEKLGVNKEIDPFMTLSFLALPVIPDIKLTDSGLFDVKNFKFIDINNKSAEMSD